MPTYANCLAYITDYLASATDYSTFSNDFIKVDTFLVKLTNLATEASKRKKDVIFVFCACENTRGHIENNQKTVFTSLFLGTSKLHLYQILPLLYL